MPTRTCAGCRKTDEQERLVRLTIEATGRVKVDKKRRLPGRGSYVHPGRACVEQMIQNSGLSKSFRRKTQPIAADGLLALLIGEEGT